MKEQYTEIRTYTEDEKNLFSSEIKKLPLKKQLELLYMTEGAKMIATADNKSA